MDRVNRKPFETLVGPFEEWPAILCERCELAALEPKVIEVENPASIAASEGAEPATGWNSGYFHGTLACPRTPCRNTHVIAGEWSRRSDVTSEGIEDDPGLAGFSVRHVLPAFPLMSLPAGVPASVTSLIEEASSVLLSDPNAAATRIRTAIERLLDEQNVRKRSQKNKSARLTTHDRIVEFALTRPDVAAQLMAVKWIGNIGSHESVPLPLDAVLRGTEHFAHALELLYDRDGQRLKRLADAINRKAGKLRARDLTRHARSPSVPLSSSMAVASRQMSGDAASVARTVH
jgi:hypothetical protein